MTDRTVCSRDKTPYLCYYLLSINQIKMSKKSPPKLTKLLLAGLFVVSLLLPSASALAIRDMTFPVIGPVTYTNDYKAPRANGPHHATDLIGKKHQRLVSTVDGVITYVAYPEPYWGYMVVVLGDDGFTYTYIHMNNDTPGTDNGRGGPMFAYAPDIKQGNRVVEGHLLGFMGDSGNAEETVDHLHFEIENPRGNHINPFRWLNEANKIKRPAVHPAQEKEILPFGQSEKTLAVALGNVDSDPEREYITASSSSDSRSHIRIYDTDKSRLGAFFAYADSFTKGVDVATGDVDGDGEDEILVSRNGGGSRIKVFELDGTEIGNFLAYYPGFNAPLRVSAGDVDNDGSDEIITAIAESGDPEIKTFELDGTPINSFMAFGVGYQRGIDVASGDVDGDGQDEIVAGKGTSVTQVRIFESDGTKTNTFLAYPSDVRTGVRVSVGNTAAWNTEEEIVTVPDNNGISEVRIMDQAGNVIDSKIMLEDWWKSFNDVAASEDWVIFGSGHNRRATLRVW